ncbi:MAG: hypothetical protein VR74_19245 [Hyphomonas sp. BRH_c22]|uniref:hypothetical protein n=1 Tax=Hyphomonas sp. BRH_c22 TaxID=1629710 RepID=UPI0005F25C44|nr:hypothetical protein [Hyphomonas sp. BRH_c22]KJS34716.1 MAG: hypothetical protein VR74_19245 [Hyphomonas sp. BRH_c22]
MLRKLIASLITIYAIAFAFGALTAVRWPSIMMAVGWIVQDDVAAGLDAVDWRALGIAYGAPYLLAALCFYCSAAMISGRRPGGVLWYVMGLCAGFPTVYLVSFEEGWWQDPSAAEGAVAGAALGGLLLMSAVYELRRRPPVRVEAVVDTAQPEPAAATPPPPPAPTPEVAIIRPRPSPPKPVFVPAAIARQRASFAAHGRRMNAKRNETRSIRLF